MDGLAGGQISG